MARTHIGDPSISAVFRRFSEATFETDRGRKMRAQSIFSSRAWGHMVLKSR